MTVVDIEEIKRIADAVAKRKRDDAKAKYEEFIKKTEIY